MKKHTMADDATIIGYLDSYEEYCKNLIFLNFF